MRTIVTILLVACLTFLVGCGGVQRCILFCPTHYSKSNGLQAWKVGSRTIGYCREVQDPKNVWLMLHGNAGQAADRAYALPFFSPRDSVFILEYPGYGARKGKPSKASFDAAAVEGYQFLRQTFPSIPICVVGESIGTGPACVLAGQSPAPDKIVLITPFDNLKSVAAEHVGSVPVGLFLEAKWDNVKSLSKYQGLVEIFAAEQDRVIPIQHAKRLAESVPSARFHSIPGGHNDWARSGLVAIKNP